jgi:hypothetical protein
LGSLFWADQLGQTCEQKRHLKRSTEPIFEQKKIDRHEKSAKHSRRHSWPNFEHQQIRTDILLFECSLRRCSEPIFEQ